MTTKKRLLKAPWKPGQSGNPAGRPKGTPNPSTKLRQMIQTEKLLKKLESAALDGDVPAAKLLLDRALPLRRMTAEPIDVPELGQAEGLADKARVVLSAVADGRVPPDVGSQLVAAIGAVGRVIEIDELERRIAALEESHGDRT